MSDSTLPALRDGLLKLFGIVSMSNGLVIVSGYHRLWLLNPTTGRIIALVNASGLRGTDDGEALYEARLGDPTCLALFDNDWKLLITEYTSGTVRELTLPSDFHPLLS